LKRWPSGYFAVGTVPGDVATGRWVTAAPADRVGNSTAVIAGTAVIWGEAGRVIRTVMSVAAIVPTSPISAATIEGLIFDSVDSGILIPTIKRFFLFYTMIHRRYIVNALFSVRIG
jgi:hypothetical protein